MVGMTTTAVQHVQELRRGARAHPIPAHKPGRRGGRGHQRRAAIAEAQR